MLLPCVSRAERVNTAVGAELLLAKEDPLYFVAGLNPAYDPAVEEGIWVVVKRFPEEPTTPTADKEAESVAPFDRFVPFVLDQEIFEVSLSAVIPKARLVSLPPEAFTNPIDNEEGVGLR